ncbi:glycosyltransferase family 4 protein [Paenibacillus radicibacter]|uniref:glycosyltransferase family 4 protein n=1 Tax=Paenibacillus radicibacter TaxID=2972488 RepID=UPI002159411C|nr:glycosyltransferase family 4 protein [Paenibacillus radicibacter]
MEICIDAISKEFAKYHRVTVIARRHSKQANHTTSGNLTIIRVPSGKSGKYLQGVIEQIRLLDCDLIQVDNRPIYAAAIKAHFPNKPVSLMMHSLTFVSKRYISHAHAASCLSNLDMIIANSSSLKQELSKLFPSQQAKIHKVFLGVDTNRFRLPSASERLAVRKKYGLHRTFNVLFVGRLVPRKGINVLMRAIHELRRKHPKIRLLIAGGSPHKAYIRSLKQYAHKLKLPVTFLGNIPHSRLRSMYWLGDCFVCPSQKHEAFGLVNVEAMASGVPVIASAIGGITEIVQDGHNGLLVRAYKDHKMFAKRIASIEESPVLAQKLKDEARSTVNQKFSWIQTANEMATLYITKINEMG